MRTCSKCGWVYPSSFTNSRCRYCKTLFNEQVCYKCKKLVPTHKFYVRSNGQLTRMCPECNRKDSRDWDNEHKEDRLERVYRFYAKRIKAADDELDKLMSAAGDLQFVPLTETEWLETCRYFKGCAICGNEHIEVRHFFVPFEEGGKYTVWNMIPLCGACAAGMPKSTGNPFKWFDRYFGNAEQLGLNEQRKERLVAYLYMRIKEG